MFWKLPSSAVWLLICLASCCIHAQLRVAPAYSTRDLGSWSGENLLQPRFGPLQGLQKVLGGQTWTSPELPPYKTGRFTLVEQSNTTCATYGESQWTGTIDVTDEHRIFLWFFESRHDPDNDPIIIWLNGGPGSSSMFGLFNECGPCWLEPDANSTIPNEWSWNSNASMLFIDQPAGVGFSSMAAILDAHRTPALGADIRVLVLNGNDDYSSNTPGLQWQYDHLRWSGQADYRIAKWREPGRDTQCRAMRERAVITLSERGCSQAGECDMWHADYWPSFPSEARVQSFPSLPSPPRLPTGEDFLCSIALL